MKIKDRKRKYEFKHIHVSPDVHTLVKIRAAEEEEPIVKFVDRLIREALGDYKKCDDEIRV